MKLTSEQILGISKGDTEIAAFITMLTQTIEQQAQRIVQLEDRVKELERQLGQNSKNSSKPPSSDGLRKPTNLRKPGGKKGAPKGHDGHTLRFAETPDEIIEYAVSTCMQCLRSLEDVPSLDYEKRQVYDLPAPRVVVTEHQAHKKYCPDCQTMQQAAFPEGVKAPVQYGTGYAAWISYLNVYQLLPLERISQLVYDLTGCRPSEATLLSTIREMANALEPVEEHIREQLLDSPVVHADETGFRVEGKGHWLHSVSNKEWTLLGVHESRGSEGIKEMGFLPLFKNILVHDCYLTYFKDSYSFVHALCNAHLLRECLGIETYDGQQWATSMKEFLQESWELIKRSREDGVPLDEEVLQAMEERYDDILADGYHEWADSGITEQVHSKGRKKKSKAANLGQRFQLHKEAILRFIRDARVPFDNNQAERDIRMAKVKLKVSGSYRTKSNAERFARIRGVISTLRKQNLPILSSLASAFRGQFSF